MTETSDRRSFFKTAGVVAAGATAITFLEADPANAAATPLNIDTSNVSTLSTTLTSSSAPAEVLFVNDGTGFAASDSGNPGALAAWSQSRTAMYAYSVSGPYGLVARVEGGSGAGVFAQAADGNAVDAFSATGNAVYASSASGTDLLAAGSGRIRANLGTFTDQPGTAGEDGEQIRDGNGEMWLWTKNPNRWSRVGRVQSGYAGGAQNVLDFPIRLLDTRAGKAANSTLKGTFTAGTTHDLQVRNLSYLGQVIPPNATAVFGNLTVVGKAHGYAILFPKGATRPNASNINYEKGQSLANSFTVKVGNANSVSIYVSGDTEVLFDVTGFLS